MSHRLCYDAGMYPEVINILRTRRVGFRDGRLYFRNRWGLFRVQGWPRMIAEKRSGENRWSPIEPRARDELLQEIPPELQVDSAGLLSVAGEGVIQCKTEVQSLMPWALTIWEQEVANAKRQWARFMQTIPELVRRAAGRLKCDIFSALELMIEAPDSIDLTEHGAVLATALARHWEFPSIACVDWAGVRKIVRGRRRDILVWLGYPRSEALVQRLERVFFDNIDAAQSIRVGLQALADPFSGTILSHVPNITARELDLVSDRWTRSWLDSELAQKVGPRLSDAIYTHFYSINRLLDANLIGLTDAKQLSRVSPRRASSRTFLPYLRPHTLPRGPSPIAAGIHQLDSLAALIGEGQEMRHCVGSLPYFLRAVVDGYVIYSVSWPVRATLALSRRDEQSWEVDELTGKCNAEVSLSDAQQIAAAFAITIDLREWNVSRCPPDPRLLEIADI